MPLRRSLLLLPLLPFLAIGAQSGTVTYDRAVRHAFTLPEGVEGRASEFLAGLPAAAVDVVALRYTPGATLMAVVPGSEDVKPADAASSGADGRTVEIAARQRAVMTRLKAASTSRSDHEVVISAHTDLETEAITEVRTFMGRTFRLARERPRIAWKLSGEQGRFLDRLVMQATADHDGTRLEAWFAPDIPIPAGPGPYGGLPGLILALTVDEDRIIFSATSIDTADAEMSLAAPTDGNAVSHAEYERIVAEKLEELRMRRRGPGTVRRDGGLE